jgi:glucokinase
MKLFDSSSSRPVAAFDIGGTRIKAGLVHDTTVSSLQAWTFDAYSSAEETLALLTSIGRNLLTQQEVSAIGVCIRGIVDARSGVLLDVNGPLSNLIGQPLAQLFAEAFGSPTSVENDARMYGLGELLYGAGQGSQNMVCLTLGTGIGSSVAIGGRVLRGPRGVSGILSGHMTIQAGGPRCTCGNVGCLEALIGTPALVEKARSVLLIDDSSVLHNQPLTPQHIFDAAANGDAAAQEVVHYFAENLAAGIVSMIHAYDPEVVVLGGGLARSTPLFLPTISAYIQEHAWTIPRGRVRIVPALLGDMASLIGVAELTRHTDRLL